MGEWIVADRAMNFGVKYKGVVVFGRLSVVEDTEGARCGLQLIMDKYFPALRPGVDYEAATDDDLKVTAVFRVDIESWSGKEKKDRSRGSMFVKVFWFDFKNNTLLPRSVVPGLIRIAVAEHVDMLVSSLAGVTDHCSTDLQVAEGVLWVLNHHGHFGERLHITIFDATFISVD
jgi:hypothetical protein